MVNVRASSMWVAVLLAACNSLVGNVEGKLVPVDDAKAGGGGTVPGGGTDPIAEGGADPLVGAGGAGNDTGGSLAMSGKNSVSGSATGGASAGSSAGGRASAGSSAGGGASAGSSAGGSGGTMSSTCPQYTGTVAKDSVIFMAGFGTATTGIPKWSGYGYTYKYGTATIMPGTGTGCFAGAKFCANGSVPADDKSGAGLGWPIAQVLNSMTISAVAITTAVTISFAGVTAGMRVQLSESPTVSYCYPITAATSPLTIPLASFKTECWGTTGTAYAGTPIQAIQVVVPGSAAGAVQPFDFCITDIEPG